MHGEEEVTCRLCGKKFVCLDNMVRHMTHEHARQDGEDIVAAITDDMQRPLPTGDDEPDRTLAKNWAYVRTKVWRRRVADVLNVRLWDGRAATEDFNNYVRFLLEQL